MYNVALEKYHSEGVVCPRDYRKGWRGSIGNVCYTMIVMIKHKMLIVYAHVCYCFFLRTIVMHANAPGHNNFFAAFVFLPSACHCFNVQLPFLYNGRTCEIE